MNGKKIIFSLFLAVLCWDCTSKKVVENENIDEADILPVNEKFFVAPFDGLNLRAGYGITGEKIKLLPQNTELTILEKSEGKETIDEMHDYWYRVDVGDETGWVFGGYLSHKPIDNKIKDMQIPKFILDRETVKFENGLIWYIEGAIQYYNNDTLVVYKENTKERDRFITDSKLVYLIKIEEAPDWFYAISFDYEMQGYVYLYDISEKSFYGDLKNNKNSGNYYSSHLNTEYEIIQQYMNIKRHGPLLTINHNGKNIEFWDTFCGAGIAGDRYLLLGYYPEFNEILVGKSWWEGSDSFIYNLEYEEYRCERIDYPPYFNKTRTYMLSLVYDEDLGVSSDYYLKLFKIDNGFYEGIFNERIKIDNEWSLKETVWKNDREVRIDYGKAGTITVEIGDKVNVVKNLVPVRRWDEWQD